MRLPDTNVLVYMVDALSPYHVMSKTWMQRSLGDVRGVGLAWGALIGFLRVSTHPRVLTTPLETTTALSVVDEWLSHPRVQIIHPGERHAGILGRLLIAAGTAGNLTNDAHLAALAIEHNAEIGTFDRDFKRFTGLRFQLLG